MASAKGHENNDKMALRFFRLVIFLSAVDSVCWIVTAAEGHSQAFIQTDSELRYLVDGVSIHSEALTSELSEESYTQFIERIERISFTNHLRFEPPSLDFKEHPVGIPVLQKVRVFNSRSDEDVTLVSISGTSVHFHCSFFEEAVLPPGANTTFDVVFLGREEGAVENTLYIHTNTGVFSYRVRALASQNPYRVKPVLGVRMPLNSSFTPLIFVHNPHPTTLQITEMYSSGGDLHLELPTGASEGPRSLWEIPPYNTRAVMRATFVARLENNHTAYIRIRTNRTPDDYLVIPVEVEVSTQPGLYSPLEKLNFGTLRNQDLPVTLQLPVINSAQKELSIQSVVTTPVNDAIKIDFEPRKVPPDTIHSTAVASATVDPSKVLSSRHLTGKLIIKSKNNQYKLTVPYEVNILKGSLDYNSSLLHFYVSDHPLVESRNLTVRNLYPVSIIIHNVTLMDEAQEYFTIKHFKPVALSPRESTQLLVLHIDSKISFLHTSSHIRLHTNLTNIDLPLLCYNGKLSLFIPPNGSASTMDLGTVGMGDRRDLFYAIINKNPMELRIRVWGSNLTRSVVELMGVEAGNETTIARRNNFSDIPKCLFLKPYHYAVFRIGIVAPDVEGVIHAESFVETNYDRIKVPFQFRVTNGSLTMLPHTVIFDDIFPGKITSQNLFVHSTFSYPMTVTEVKANPPDPRFSFEEPKASDSTVMPWVRSLIGKLIFNPQAGCGENCYSSMQMESSSGKKWIQSLSLPPYAAKLDKKMYAELIERLQQTRSYSNNVTLTLDTNEVRGFKFHAQLVYQWPRLITRKKLKFAVTQVGNMSEKEFSVENPASLPVIAQVILVHTYNSNDAVQQLVEYLSTNAPQKYKDQFSSMLLNENSNVFSFPDTSRGKLTTGNSPSLRRSFHESFGVEPHEDSVTVLLAPESRTKVRLRFTPDDNVARSSLILIRNNLTIVDAMVVQGRGGYRHLKFGNRKAGASLQFEITDKHLKDCDKKRATKYAAPNFTVKRSFNARNTGELPILVKGFSINGSPCEGYGFRIINCQGFELLPNSSTKVDIAFTPDFTMSKIQRVLSIHTNVGDEGLVNYTLVATVPGNMLTACMGALPRPSWEPLLYYATVSFMMFLLFCVLAAAFFESDRILKYGIITFSAATPRPDEIIDKSKVFNLKTIGHKVDVRNSRGELSNGYIDHGRKNKELLTHSNRVSKTTTNTSRNHSREKEIDNEFLSKPKKKLTKTHSVEKENCNSPDNFSKKSSWANIFSTKVGNSSNKDHLKTDNNIKKPETPITIIEDVAILEKVNVKKKNDKGTIKTEKKVKKGRQSPAEDETDSTTTEASNPDDNSSEKDNKLSVSQRTAIVYPNQQSLTRINKKEKARSKSRSSDLEPISLGIVDDDGGDFELSTKSKAHRKIKVDHSKVFGGDILKPSTLELPYKPKPIKSLENNKEKVKKSARVKGVPQNTHIGDRGLDSPPPLWDQPTRGRLGSDDSLSEFVSQTQKFAIQTGRMSESPSPTSSYSGILTGKSIEKPKNKVTPVGKIIPEVKKPEPKAFGVVGAPFLNKNLGNIWSNDSSLYSSVGYHSNPFVDRIQEEEPRIKDEQLAAMGLGSGYTAASMWRNPPMPSSGWDGRNEGSMMQALQAERRKRLEEYQRAQMFKDEWPGFSTTPSMGMTMENLWDPGHAPITTPTTTAQTSMFSSLMSNLPSLYPTSLWQDANPDDSTKRKSVSPQLSPGQDYGAGYSVMDIWNQFSESNSEETTFKN